MTKAESKQKPIEQPKRKVGRPANPKRTEEQAARRFYSIQKTDAFVALVEQAKTAYRIRHGVDAKTDTELFRDALGQYLKVK